jgi:hypothetical protein
MSLAPESAKVGGLVFLLMGGNVPFVLRPAEGSTWTLVGHCYIHGIMDGEAFDERKCGCITLV